MGLTKEKKINRREAFIATLVVSYFIVSESVCVKYILNIFDNQIFSLYLYRLNNSRVKVHDTHI